MLSDDEEEDELSKAIASVCPEHKSKAVRRQEMALDVLQYPVQVSRSLERAKDVLRVHAPLHAMEACRAVEHATRLLVRHAYEDARRKRRAAVDAAAELQRAMDAQERPMLAFSLRQQGYHHHHTRKRRQRRKRKGEDNTRETS